MMRLMNRIQQTDAQLLHRYINGEDKAFEALYNRHVSSLYQYIYRRCGDHSMAEEVFQTVFIRVSTKPDLFARVENLKTYLFGTAHRELLLHLRSQRNYQKHVSPYPGDFLQISDTSQEETWTDIALALQQLPEEQAEIVLLHVRDDFTFEEIGQVLDISPKTAASRYYLGREKLKLILTDKE